MLRQSLIAGLALAAFASPAAAAVGVFANARADFNNQPTQYGAVHAENAATTTFTYACPAGTCTGAASARSYADLATGKIGAESFADPNMVAARAGAGWDDVLTFSLPDDGSDPTINFSYLVDGSLEADPDGCSGCNNMGFNLGITEINSGGSATYLFGGSAAVYSPETAAYPFQSTSYLAPFGTILSFDRNGITGRFTPRAGMTYQIHADVSTSGVSSYYHTATFRLPNLPAGVSFTSQSGTFLSDASAAPEPAAWALLIVGFGGAGAMLRRRRNIAATRP